MNCNKCKSIEIPYCHNKSMIVNEKCLTDESIIIFIICFSVISISIICYKNLLFIYRYFFIRETSQEDYYIYDSGISHNSNNLNNVSNNNKNNSNNNDKIVKENDDIDTILPSYSEIY